MKQTADRASRRRSCRSDIAPGSPRRTPGRSALAREPLTSISSVDLGRWKFVIIASTARNRKPGVMNRSVSPWNAATVCHPQTAPSEIFVARA